MKEKKLVFAEFSFFFIFIVHVLGFLHPVAHMVVA